MRRFLLPTLLLAFGADAYAGNLGTVKTMRDPMPSREVERPLTMTKGWLEFGLGYDHKIGTGRWTEDGSIHKFDDTTWTYGTAQLDVRYGISRRGELWWSLPYHYAHLVNEGQGTDTSDTSIGDPSFGYRHRLLRNEAPLRDLVFEVGYKGPAGKESPGSYLGGPLNVASFVFTTGTPDLTAGFAGKVQFGPLAVQARLNYTRRFSGVVQYLVELNETQFAGRIKPGDLAYLEVGVMAQLGPVMVSATPEITYRAATAIGTTAGAPTPNANLETIEGSDGLSVDLRADALVHITRGFDVGAMVVIPVRGEDLQFFPIEDLHPTYGYTVGGKLELRY